MFSLGHILTYMYHIDTTLTPYWQSCYTSYGCHSLNLSNYQTDEKKTACILLSGQYCQQQLHTSRFTKKYQLF